MTDRWFRTVKSFWFPAFAGMTEKEKHGMTEKEKHGMTEKEKHGKLRMKDAGDKDSGYRGKWYRK